MKFLALDVGDRRVGTAIGDDEVRVATPLQVITRRSIRDDAHALSEIISKYEVTGLVVGIPRNMDGTEGAQAQSVKSYADEIAHVLHIPVTLWDERLTTVEAEQWQKHGQVERARIALRGKKSRRALDAVAASIILQDFLDSRENVEQ